MDTLAPATTVDRNKLQAVMGKIVGPGRGDNARPLHIQN